MKLIYISPLRYPSDRAGSIFSMKSCEVFASENVDVELWIPWRREVPSDVDLFQYFGVKRNFKIRVFPAIDLTGLWSKTYHLLYFSFAFSVFCYSLTLRLFGKLKTYVFYSHEQFALFLLTFINKNTFYEMHDFPGNQKIYHKLFNRIKGVITTNTWKSEEVSKQFHIAKQRICLVPNAVDMQDFSAVLSIENARVRFGVSLSDHIFGYVGTLKTMDMDKGFSTAILALQFLPANFKLYVIGADSPKDLEYYKDFAKKNNLDSRVIFVGQIPHKDVPLYMSVCNVLIAPFPKNDHYSYYMSPMKIFEYMASKRPIITTDLPSIREVLRNEETALFTPPSDPEALGKAIYRLREDSDLSQKLAQNAYTEVSQKYTWDKRAKKILAFIS